MIPLNGLRLEAFDQPAFDHAFPVPLRLVPAQNHGFAKIRADIRVATWVAYRRRQRRISMVMQRIIGPGE